MVMGQIAEEAVPVGNVFIDSRGDRVVGGLGRADGDEIVDRAAIGGVERALR